MAPATGQATATGQVTSSLTTPINSPGRSRGWGIRKLEQLAQRMHHKPLADLTSLEASGLIDTLKAIKAGDVGLAAALEGSREAA